MKKSVKILLIVLCAALVVGVGVTAFFVGRGSGYIGKDRALDMALADMGLSRRDVADVDVDLERRGAEPYYEVDFELLTASAGPTDVVYYIDAATGAVINWTSEGPTGRSTVTTAQTAAPQTAAPQTAAPQTATPKPDVAKAPSGSTAPQNSIAAQGPAQTGDQNSAGQSGAADGQYIGREQALAIALNDAGLTAAEAYDQDVDLELRHGASAYYEVDFDSVSTDYKYYIDAVTGEILSSRVETEGLGPAPSTGAQSGDYISRDDAISAALANAGLTQADVYDLDAELDIDGGIARYEVDFETASTEYEYDIDALTGEILRSRAEPNR